MLKISQTHDGTLLRLHTACEPRPLTPQAHHEIHRVIDFAMAAKIPPVVVESDRGVMAVAIAPEA